MYKNAKENVGPVAKLPYVTRALGGRSVRQLSIQMTCRFY
jgi:hypothetical protein